MEPIKINNTGSKREIKKKYNATTRQMEVIPPDMRCTVDAYQRFKQPAFSYTTGLRRKGDKSEKTKK